MTEKQDSLVGQRVDLSAFAAARWWTGAQRHDLAAHDLRPGADGCWRAARASETGPWQFGLEWAEPRDIREVIARYAGPAPADLELQYWRHHWPTPAPERRAGARRGWIGRDDPWHGQWTTVIGERTLRDGLCAFTFDPVDLVELGRQAADQLLEAEHYRAPFRRTLKIRLVSAGSEPPPIQHVEVYSAAVWQEGLVDVRFGVRGDASADWSGEATAVNGHILGVVGLELDEGESAEGAAWRCRTSGASKDVRLRVLYAACAADSTDQTLVRVRTTRCAFTFRVADLDRGPIYLPNYDVYIAWADAAPSFEAYQREQARAPRPIYERVVEEPEQSLERAMAEIPPLDVLKQAPFGRYLPLSLEAGRQEFAVRYNGELFADKLQLKLAGRDAARLQWPGHQVRYCFGTGDPPRFREGAHETRQRLLDGWLPVVISEWLDREIAYEQTVFVAPLHGPMTAPERRRGDEDAVAMVRLRLRNTTHGRKRACLWIAVAPQEALALQENLVLARGRAVPAEPVARQWRVAPYESSCLRFALRTRGSGRFALLPHPLEGEGSQTIPNALLYEAELEGGASEQLDLVVPFVSLTQPGEWQAASRLDFDAKLAAVASYWRERAASGGEMDVPERVLADFHKAVAVHIGIAVDKEPESGLYVVPAAAWAYSACGNEACWQITVLDQAGHYDRAEAYLETFLRTQGLVRPDGRFGSAEGALQGMDIVGMGADGIPRIGRGFAYNLDHGVIMECLANHYRLTGDQAWLRRVAPHLVAACELVIRERQSTQTRDEQGRPVPEWGLLPPGHLEDNPEWRHWFAVNAHACGGMAAIAEALGEIGHPEAARLAAEAAAYRADIRKAALRAMEEAPVVRLRDGTYVPHIPTRVGQSVSGREWGWFREAAYGALHLMEAGVFEPREEPMTWLLQDLEDNLFVSREWGRPVDMEEHWFSHGGVTIQANLMDLAIDYLRRGEIEHALRALYNNLAASLYPDVRAFTEHPVVELGHGVGPFYKASDEAKSLVWLRAFLLQEEGDCLWLAPGAPRAWFAPGQTFGVREMATFFGPLSYRVRSQEGETVVEIACPTRKPPAEIRLRIRRLDRAPMQRVTVNGQPHGDWDASAETVRIVAPRGALRVCASV